jgi:hypothetical protein
MTKRIATVEAPDTEGIVDILSTAEHHGAAVKVTVKDGKIHVEVEICNGSSTWDFEEHEYDLTPKTEADLDSDS